MERIQEQSAATDMVNPPISIIVDSFSVSEEVAVNTSSTSTSSSAQMCNSEETTSRDRLDALASMLDSCLEQVNPLAAMGEETARIELPPLPVPPLAETSLVQSADRTSAKRRRRTRCTPLPGTLENAVRGHLYDMPDFQRVAEHFRCAEVLLLHGIYSFTALAEREIPRNVQKKLRYRIVTHSSNRLSGRRPAISQTKTSSLSLPTVSVAWKCCSSWLHVDIRKNLYANVLLFHRETVVQLMSIATQSSNRLRN